MEACTHLDTIRVTTTTGRVCEDCVLTGDPWLHLRMCTTCGHVGCCDSSPNRHATKHHQKTGHPIVCSAEPGERWMWCYEDNFMMGEVPA